MNLQTGFGESVNDVNDKNTTFLFYAFNISACGGYIISTYLFIKNILYILYIANFNTLNPATNPLQSITTFTA